MTESGTQQRDAEGVPVLRVPKGRTWNGMIAQSVEIPTSKVEQHKLPKA
jgi:hypothetical protein